ncbi:MAG: hypothetical protein KJO55_08880 [Gammaproteobacteria bacterium]|nr:hypothetical protein [Gammaproteobacteria bacterium]
MLKHTTFAALIAAGLLGLAACDINDGPAEELGENLDETAEELEDAVEDASN